MKITVALLLLLMSGLLYAETLDKKDLVGLWESTWPTTEGEKSSLLIRADLSSEFVRDFPDNEDQHFSATASNVDCLGDIRIFNYSSDDPDYGYRIAVSGWKTNKTARLFGTLFMYKDGELFNGLPISFEKKVNKSLQPTADASAE